MLLISLFTDLGYFYINLYSTTGDYRSNSLSKYNYFTKNNLKVFEETVDEIITDLKNKVKKAIAEG